MDHVHRYPGGAEGLSIVEPIFLIAHHDEIGAECNNRNDIRILGTADMADPRLLAEPRTSDWFDECRKCFSKGRD